MSEREPAPDVAAAPDVEPGLACIVLMGLAGAGQAAVGRRLASTLGWEFVDGDELPPAAGLGTPNPAEVLGSGLRLEWLRAISDRISTAVRLQQPMVIACSVLKRESRRDFLSVHPRTRFFLLHVPFSNLARQFESSSPASRQPSPREILSREAQALEWPELDECVVVLDGRLSPGQIVDAIRMNLPFRPTDLPAPSAEV